MNIKNIYFSVSCFFFWPIIIAQPIIQLTFIQSNEQKAKQAEKKIKKYGSTGKLSFDRLVHHQSVAGFFATYAGALNVSDNNGTILFARKHVTPVVYLAITEEIIPIMRLENTVNHWEFIKNRPAVFYKLEVHTNQKGIATWNIQELELPKNLVIPAETIVVFGNPTVFSFDSSLTDKAYIHPNIILPPLFIKKGTNAMKSALYLLSVKHLFSDAQPPFKQQQKLYQIIPQP